MIFIALLTAITLIYAALGICIWVRTGNIVFPVGLAFLYYWTLYGAWFIVTDQLRGNSILRYQYLYAKLFPVYLNEAYLWTIAVYGIFLFSIEALLLIFARKLPVAPGRNFVPVISHTALLGFGVVAGLISFLSIRGSVENAAQEKVSAYELVRIDEQAMASYRTHQLLMQAALFCAATGFAILISGRDARVVRANSSATAGVGYGLLLICLFFLNYKLGQRKAFASASISAGLFYLVNAKRPRWLLPAGGTIIMLVAMGLVSMTRGDDIPAGQPLTETVENSLTENLLSNEPFAAHLSLYGSIAYKVPATYGSSLVYLAASLVPGAPRPMDIYDYYAQSVKAIEGQGYNVHHATGWYLNFGLPGVIAGGALLGFVWAALFLGFQLRDSIGPHAIRMLLAFGVWCFTASLPSICRAGPEGYKGLFFDAGVLPAAIMTFATIRAVKRQGRLRLVPRLE